MSIDMGRSIVLWTKQSLFMLEHLVNKAISHSKYPYSFPWQKSCLEDFMKLEWRKYDILGKWGTPPGTWSHVRPSLSQLQTWTTRSNPANHRTSTSETRYNSLYITSGTEARTNLAYHSIMNCSRNIIYLNNSTAKIQALLMFWFTYKVITRRRFLRYSVLEGPCHCFNLAFWQMCFCFLTQS